MIVIDNYIGKIDYCTTKLGVVINTSLKDCPQKL